ncbi:MAG TPA: SAM-dependent methyltransferase, partial [Candidatus Eisenbacteria bacterium]|nr:SAM-dependent methyltransferase [Candidatus Eisenbacteria bacterium]
MAPAARAVQVRVPYVPTPAEVVDRMLTVAGVTKDDVVYDLGSGDGRIPIA